MNNCAHCGSFDTIAGLDQNQCLRCGNHTHADGSKVAPLPRVKLNPWFGRSNVESGGD